MSTHRDPSGRILCSATQRNGLPCHFGRVPGSEFCGNHDPALAAKRRSDGAKRHRVVRTPTGQEAHEVYLGATRTIAEIAARAIEIADRARSGQYDDQDSERGAKVETNALKLAKEALESERDHADRLAAEEAKRSTREGTAPPGDVSSLDDVVSMN